MMDDPTDDDVDFEEPEASDSIEETPSYGGRPALSPDPVRDAEEKERQRWLADTPSEEVRQTLLRAWEQEDLAGTETRERRLTPFNNDDPIEYKVDKSLPPMAKPAEKTARRYESCTDVLDDTETELTAVIAECRYFMREMVFESARTTPIASDRIKFIESARGLAEVSAKVGHSVAVVRNPALIPPEEKKKRARR